MMHAVTVAFAALLVSPALIWSAQAISHGPKRQDVDRTIIHTISGPACDNGKVVYTGADGDSVFWKQYFESHVFLSIHYVIDRDGTTTASVPEDEVANHALGWSSPSEVVRLLV